MKVCERCAAAYSRPLRLGSKLWVARRYCSQACSLSAQTSDRRPCSAEGCVNLNRGTLDYCNLHRQRVRKHGDPDHGRWPSTWDRFVDRVLVLASDCWMWLGSGTGRGHAYGQFWFNNRTGTAHRYAYQTMVGSIPEGLEIDHLCRNRSCVNPAHLEPVTAKENMRRMIVAKKGAQ